MPLPQPMPARFPVFPGAIAEEPPADDSGAIAVWLSPRTGSDAYDFYRAALGRDGYAVLGLYPSESAALIRFVAPDGRTLQLVTELAGTQTRITVRTDRP